MIRSYFNILFTLILFSILYKTHYLVSCDRVHKKSAFLHLPNTIPLDFSNSLTNLSPQLSPLIRLYGIRSGFSKKDYIEGKESRNIGSNINENTKQSRHLEHMKVNLRTGLLPSSSTKQKKLSIDQQLEVIVSPESNIYSLKKTIFRRFCGKPPIQLIVLTVDGVDNDIILDDNLTVKEIMDEYYEDMIEWNELDGGEGLRLRIVVDIIPPVDPKFGIQFIEKVGDMSIQDLIKAYTANWVCLRYNSKYILASSFSNDKSKGTGDRLRRSTIQKLRHEMEIFQSLILDTFESNIKEINPLMSIQKDFIKNKEGSMNWSYKVVDCSDKSGSDISNTKFSENSIGKRVKGDSWIFNRDMLRKNFNINWHETLRTSLLFCFFGYFGSRDDLSRRLMFLSSIMCVLAKTRPFKIVTKRMFYLTVNAPGILLTLLPVPYQVILSFDHETSIKDKSDNIEDSVKFIYQ